MPSSERVNTWASNPTEGSRHWLTTPTGSECEAVRIGLQGMVKAGILGDADSLTAFVDSKHVRRVRGGKVLDQDTINVQSLMNDPEQLGKVMMMVDRAMPFVVTDPVVHLHFTDEPGGTTKRVPDGDRAEGVYTDQIPFEDKMYLFNWSVGGTGDGERFRSESDAVVAGVDDGEDVPVKAKRAAGNKRRR